MEQLGKCTINIRKPTYIYSIYLHWGSLGGKCIEKYRQILPESSSVWSLFCFKMMEDNKFQHTLPKFNVNAGAQNLLNKHNTLDTVQLLGSSGTATKAIMS